MIKNGLYKKVVVCTLLGTMCLTGCSKTYTYDVKDIKVVEKVEETKGGSKKETEEEVIDETEDIKRDTESIEKETEIETDEPTYSGEEIDYGDNYLDKIMDIIGEDNYFLITMFSILKGEDTYIGDFSQSMTRDEVEDTVKKSYENILNYPKLQIITNTSAEYRLIGESGSSTIGGEALYIMPDTVTGVYVRADENDTLYELSSFSDIIFEENGSIHRMMLHANSESSSSSSDEELDVFTNVIDTALKLHSFQLCDLNTCIGYDSTQVLYAAKSTDMNTSLILVYSDIFNGYSLLLIKDDMVQIIVQLDSKYDKKTLRGYDIYYVGLDNIGGQDSLSYYLNLNAMMHNEISDTVLEAFEANSSDETKEDVGWDEIRMTWKEQR